MEKPKVREKASTIQTKSHSENPNSLENLTDEEKIMQEFDQPAHLQAQYQQSQPVPQEKEVIQPPKQTLETKLQQPIIAATEKTAEAEPTLPHLTYRICSNKDKCSIGAQRMVLDKTGKFCFQCGKETIVVKTEPVNTVVMLGNRGVGCSQLEIEAEEPRISTPLEVREDLHLTVFNWLEKNGFKHCDYTGNIITTNYRGGDIGIIKPVKPNVSVSAKWERKHT